MSLLSLGIYGCIFQKTNLIVMSLFPTGSHQPFLHCAFVAQCRLSTTFPIAKFVRFKMLILKPIYDKARFFIEERVES
jgi:hypothetical protein